MMRSLSHFLGLIKKSAQAALIEHENYFCPVIRGSSELNDCLHNISVFATKELFAELYC